MIIEKISLKNWRGYRELHTFSFDKGFNLVVGRNEAGKSTLFEALARVMFDRFSSKAEEIRKIQPLNSSLGPEAEIIFIDNGKRLKIKKRFIHAPISELSSERNGRWELDHEGDKADSELQKILKGNSSSRASQPEHRGLAQALWYLQNEDPLPKKVWADGIKQDLAGIIEFVIKRPEEDAICNSIDDLYNRYWTSQSGKIKSGCELASLKEEISQKENEFEDLRIKASNVENLRLELEGLYEVKLEKQNSLLTARDELTNLKQQLEIADRIEAQKSVKDSEITDLNNKIKGLMKELTTIDRRIKSIDDLKEKLSEAKEVAERCEADSRIEQNAEEKYHNKWKNDLEPKLKKIEDELSLLHKIENLSRLVKSKEILHEYLSKLSKADEEYQTKKKKLAELIAPSKHEWNVFEENWDHFQIVEAEAKASAIRIKFDLNVGDSDIRSNPTASHTDVKHEYLVLSPTIFDIKKIGKIHVRGGGSSLGEIIEKSKSLQKSIQNTFSQFNVRNKQDLSDRYQNRIDLEREVKQLKKNLDALLDENKDNNSNEEFRRLEQEIIEESQSIESAPATWKKMSGKDLREKITQTEKTKKQLVDDIEKEQSNEKISRDNSRTLFQNAIEERGKFERSNSEINSLNNENVETLKNYGSRDNLVSLIEKNRNLLSTVNGDLNNILMDYEKMVDLPRKLYADGEHKVTVLEEQIRTNENQIIDRKARIEESAAQGLYSQISDLEGLLEIKKRRLASVQLEANSIKLLHDMIIALRKEQSTMLAGPISELVNRYLVMLTDDSYAGLELNEELLPIAIQSNRYGTQLPLDSLSYGTHEQIVVLLRLALGVILSKNERNLVVIDDRLVNADPMRMKRLSLILQEVSNNSCQIIVATCNDTPYTGIKGHVISVPSDGKLT